MRSGVARSLPVRRVAPVRAATGTLTRGCGERSGSSDEAAAHDDRKNSHFVGVPMLGNWQRHLEARTAARRRGGTDAAVVRDDDLLDKCEAEASTSLFRGEERTEDLLARVGGNARAVVA